MEIIHMDALEVLVKAGLQDLELDFGAFYALLGKLADLTHSSSLDALARDLLVPLAAAAGATVGTRKKKTPLKTLALLRKFMPNLWQLFLRYAEDDWGHRQTSVGAFPESAQAAEHAIAGIDVASAEPAARDFHAPHARGLALSETGLVHLFEGLGFLASRPLLRRAHRAARAYRAEVFKGRPRRSPTQKTSPAVATIATATQKRRVLAQAAHFSARLNDIHNNSVSSSSMSSSSSSSSRQKRTTHHYDSRHGKTNHEDHHHLEEDRACPGLSFCEFIEVPASHD